MSDKITIENIHLTSIDSRKIKIKKCEFIDSLKIDYRAARHYDTEHIWYTITAKNLYLNETKYLSALSKNEVVSKLEELVDEWALCWNTNKIVEEFNNFFKIHYKESREEILDYIIDLRLKEFEELFNLSNKNNSIIFSFVLRIRILLCITSLTLLTLPAHIK